jgi:hypothetical protein
MGRASGHTSLRTRGAGVGAIGLAANIALWLVGEFWVKMPHAILYVGSAIATLLAVAGVVLMVRDSRSTSEESPAVDIEGGSYHSEDSPITGYRKPFRSRNAIVTVLRSPFRRRRL